MSRRLGPEVSEVEERKIIYVGNIADGVTRDDFRKTFSKFGQVLDVSLHFRDAG